MSSISFVHHGFKTPTKETADLADEFKKRGVKVYVELNDGFKHVDLAILKSKLNVEVDGVQHLDDPNQIITDFKRDYYSHLDGFYTLRIHNEDLKKHLNSIAKAIEEIVKKANKI